MDYTCVNYNVEAWEGRAYSYGMQASALVCFPCQTWPRHCQSCLLIKQLCCLSKILMHLRNSCWHNVLHKCIAVQSTVEPE